MKVSGYKLKTIASALSLAVLTSIASPLASAQDAYWYGGANVGKTTTNIASAVMVPRLQTLGYSTASTTDDDDDVGFKLVGGYRFNRNFAIEGSVFDLGKFGFRSVLVPNANLAGNIRPRGAAFDLVGFLPLSATNSLFARAGLNYAEVRESFSARTLASHPYAKQEEKDVNYKFGFGFQHDFTDKLALRVEAERYHLDEPIGLMDSADLYSVGVVYRFGAKAAPAAAPAPVAAAPRAAPAPAPAPAAPPPPPPPTRITLMADTAFDFDKETLKAGGSAELDKLIADLRALSYDSIAIVGHTDRIGSDSYNMSLSQRRAQTVKDYLVSKGNIPAAKINASGKGESSPVTRADQCQNLARPGLITCLAADRRVEVEVVGTK